MFHHHHHFSSSSSSQFFIIIIIITIFHHHHHHHFSSHHFHHQFVIIIHNHFSLSSHHHLNYAPDPLIQKSVNPKPFHHQSPLHGFVAKFAIYKMARLTCFVPLLPSAFSDVCIWRWAQLKFARWCFHFLIIMYFSSLAFPIRILICSPSPSDGFACAQPLWWPDTSLCL